MSDFKLNEFEGKESFCGVGDKKVGDMDGDGRYIKWATDTRGREYS